MKKTASEYALRMVQEWDAMGDREMSLLYLSNADPTASGVDINECLRKRNSWPNADIRS